MSVLAQFYVTDVQLDDNGMGHITLATVKTALISIGKLNAEEAKYIKVGGEYYISFSRIATTMPETKPKTVGPATPPETFDPGPTHSVD